MARFSMVIGGRGVELGSGYEREELGAVVGRLFGTAMVEEDIEYLWKYKKLPADDLIL